MLVEIIRAQDCEIKKDFYEDTADILLKPLRLSCGRCVSVNKEFHAINEVTTHNAMKIFYFVILIAFTPITLPLTLIGFAFAAFSDSYQKISSVFSLKEQEFIIPPRRLPPFGACDTIRPTLNSVGERIEEYLKGYATFLSEQEIVQIHPMKFLPSPFPADINDTERDRREKGLAITKDGKHVILQQGNRACVPTAIGMLVLDNGGRANFEAIRQTNIATDERAIQWIRDAGFIPVVNDLRRTNDKISELIRLIHQNGPGKLGIVAPEMGGHAIVLDSISLSDRTAVIRDPYHGWMVTITLDTLLGMHPDYFIQIQKS